MELDRELLEHLRNKVKDLSDVGKQRSGYRDDENVQMGTGKFRKLIEFGRKIDSENGDVMIRRTRNCTITVQIRLNS
jgi:hypothetical protein